MYADVLLRNYSFVSARAAVHTVRYSIVFTLKKPPRKLPVLFSAQTEKNW